MKICKNSIDNQKSFITKDGSAIRSIMDAANSCVKNVSLAEASVEAGGQTLKHMHRKSEEIYYFTDGTGIMQLGSRKFKVNKGDAVLIPPEMAHKIFNTGRQTMRILCACDPVYSHSDTFTLENRYKLAIFDFDGTLVDSVGGIWKTADEMAELFNMKGFKRSDIVTAVGTGLDSFVKDLFPEQVKNMGQDEVIKTYRKFYDKSYIEGLRVFKNVKKTLAYLYAKGMKMAIVSNKLKKYVDNICREVSIYDYFDITLGSADVLKMKPDPWPVTHLMKKYRVKKRDILFIGDSQYDILTAKNAGVDSVYLTYGYADKSLVKKYKPSYVLSDFGKIREIV